MKVIDEITQKIKSNKQILLGELNRYGSQLSKDKKHYNCCHCNSSDALGIKETNDGYIYYHCFSCNTGGDVIKLVQLQEGVNFLEAIKIICDRYGLDFQSKKIEFKPDPKVIEAKKLLKKSDELINKNFEEAYLLRMKANELTEKKSEEEESPVLKINKNLYEYQEEIQTILDLKGYILMTAPTGAGKTYSIVKSFKEKSKDKDRVFIILCPNRVQNEQNGQDYNINVVIGGKRTEQHIQVLSAVYEKISEIMEAYRDKKITLVIDEAHQLIESISYREKAIKKIDEASKKAYNVIHLTATDRKLKEYYTYNYIFKFDYETNQNNLDTLSIIPSKDVEENLFKLLKINKNNNKKSLVFLSGSKQNMLNISETLKKKNYNVGTITSTDKHSLLYRNIVEKSSIATKYDVILSTKVLECGTNIKDSNVVPIEVIENPKHFDLDSTEQKFARLRTKNQSGYILFQEKKAEENNIKSFYEIKNDIETSLKYCIEGIKAFISASNIGIADIKMALEESLKLYISAVSGALHNSLEIDENLNIIVNKKKIINAAFREYDKQFLYNDDELKKELEKRIKADNVEVLFDISDEETQAFKEDLKETKKLQKEIKEANTEKAKNIINKLASDTYLEEYLYSEDRFLLMQNYENYVPEVYEKLHFVEEEEKELLKVQKLYNVQVLSENFEMLIKFYNTCKSVSDADRYAKHFNYLTFNQINSGDVPDMYSSYGILRRKFDKVKNKQGRITQKDIISVVTELHTKKLLWQFDKQRMKQDFEAYLKETDKKKRDKILKRITEKTINELSLIYEVRNDEKGYYISSLK